MMTMRKGGRQVLLALLALLAARERAERNQVPSSLHSALLLLLALLVSLAIGRPPKPAQYVTPWCLWDVHIHRRCPFCLHFLKSAYQFPPPGIRFFT